MIDFRAIANFITWSLLGTMSPSQAFAADLIQIEAADHPPLFVDPSSIQRDGAIVTVAYVINSASGSNKIEAIIDCSAKTYALDRVFLYTEPLGGGRLRGTSEPPAAERSSRPIPTKSTWDYLARHICPR